MLTFIIPRNLKKVKHLENKIWKRGEFQTMSTLEDRIALARNIKKLREEKGMTQEDIAKIAKVSKNAVSKYELVEMIPNGLVMLYIARGLGTTCEGLVNHDILEADKNKTTKN